MDVNDSIELIGFLVATCALLLWIVGEVVLVVLRVLGRSNGRLAGFLSPMKEVFGEDWLGLGAAILLVALAIALKSLFDRSVWVGWLTLGMLSVAGIVVLRVFTRERFWPVLLAILSFGAAFADLIFLIAMTADHGALIAVGLLGLQVALALGIALVISRSAFGVGVFVLGFLSVLLAPALVPIGIGLLDEHLGRPVSLPALGLSLVVTGTAAGYLWLIRDSADSESSALIGAYALVWALALVVLAFLLSMAIGWAAIGLLVASAYLAVVLGTRWRRPSQSDAESLVFPKPDRST